MFVKPFGIDAILLVAEYCVAIHRSISAEVFRAEFDLLQIDKSQGIQRGSE
jgi:hypothetical protein